MQAIEEKKTQFNSNKRDIGEVIIGGAVTGLSLAAAIWTGCPLLYGAAVFLTTMELSTVSDYLKAERPGMRWAP